MKFLLLFLVVLVLAWRWRTWREAVQRNKKNLTNRSATTADFIACQHCGLHVPIQDAISGVKGSYCSKDHQHEVED